MYMHTHSPHPHIQVYFHYTHAYMHIHVHVYTTHMHSHSLIHTHTHTHSHTYIHTSLTYTHTCTHRHTYTHTQVVLGFQYIPHFEQDTVDGTDRSEESTSPPTIVEGENQSNPFGTSSHRYANGESSLNDPSHDVEREGLHLDSSQDPELVVNPSWPSASSQVGNSELETVVSAETLGVSEWKSVILDKRELHCFTGNDPANEETPNST